MADLAAPGLWLITRAQPGAEATAARLAAMGVAAIATPVLVIEPIVGADLMVAEACALAFTSAAGVAAYAGAHADRDRPVFVVGAATARAAHAAGFSDVTSADGNVVDLSKAIIAARADRVLHISGEDQAGDLVGTLRAAGLRAWRRIGYRAAPAPALAPEALTAIETGRAEGVLFHSARGASVFASLTPTALHDRLKTLAAACLSPAVAAAASALPFGNIRVAAHPDEDAILALTRPTAAEA